MGVRRLGHLWPWAMALLVCLPMLAHGYVLSYDMVFVPRLDITRPDVWGLGTATPRAVPSDALVAVANLVVPGWLLQKVVLLGALVAAGAGAMRLVRSLGLPAQLVAASWYVWNPYVAERLVIGHWPLLLAYAAFAWLAATLLDVRAGRPVRAWRWLVPLAVTGLTAATGVMGVVLVVSVLARRERLAVLAKVAVAALVVNLPWILAGLRQPGLGRTASVGVEAFSLRAEDGLGRLGTAVSLGGIWNADVVPTSRTLPVAVLSTVLVVVALGLGAVLAWRQRGQVGDTVVALAPAAVVGLAVAFAGALAPGALGWAVEHVPGSGMLRDGARWLGLLTPLQAWLLGVATAWASARLRRGFTRTAVLVVAALLPLLVMPDLAWGAGGRLEPVRYPAAWDEIAETVADSPVRGDLLALPFSAYRAPAWNRRHPVLDPAGRYFARETVVSDDLVVSGRLVPGEDPRARRVGAALASEDPVAGLRHAGIGLVVVEDDAPGATDVDRVRGALTLVVRRGDLSLYAVPQS